MPLVRLRDGRLVRPPYHAWSYSVPALWPERMAVGGYSNPEILAEYDGPFRELRQGARFERDGTPWMTLSHPSDDWSVEIELTSTIPPPIAPIPPWRTWELARSHDDPSTEVRPFDPGELAELSHRAAAAKIPAPRFGASPEDVAAVQRELATHPTVAALLSSTTSHGALRASREVCRFEREGKRWVRLVAPLGWIVDVELSDGPGAEVRPLAAELAEKIVREPVPPPDLP